MVDVNDTVSPVSKTGMILIQLAERISQRDFFIAVRRALILPFPLMMVGAIALLLQYPPLGWTSLFLSPERIAILEQGCKILVSGTFGIAALVIIGGFAAAFTNLNNEKLHKYKINPAITTSIVLSCFFIAILPTDGEPFEPVVFASSELLAAAVVALASTLFFIFLANRRQFRLPIKVLSHDPLVGDVFEILPAAIVTLAVFGIWKLFLSLIGASNFEEYLEGMLLQLLMASDSSLLSAMLYEGLCQVLWFFGLHGPNLLNIIQNELYIPATVANNIAFQSGQEPVNLVTSQFFDIFIRLGGSGSTLCLVLSLLFISKSANSRKFALIALIPALCNINEPLLFGIPLVMNPIFIIPFIFVPVMQIVITYIAMTLDLVPLTSQNAYWTTPIFISGYMVTGGDIAGSIMQGVNLAAGAALYYPFVKLSEILSLRRNMRTLNGLLERAETNRVSLPQAQLIGLEGEHGRMAISLADELKVALRQTDQIYLEYQPQVDIRTQRVIGAEALLRWNHPQYGQIAPPIAVALAEDLGIIDQLGFKVLEIACTQRVRWIHGVDDDFRVSVNVSPGQLADRDFGAKVEQILKKAGMSPTLLELEITEKTALLPDTHFIDSLVHLRNIGVEVALDDFGMGHTSLHYLRMLPIDTVKVDRSLTVADGVNERIVKSIQELSASLDLQTIVEGVEEGEQVLLFSAMGCPIFQGYYFSKPLVAEQFLRFKTDFERRNQPAKEQPVSARMAVPYVA